MNHTFSVPYGVFTSAVLHICNNYSFLLVVESLITNAFLLSGFGILDERHRSRLRCSSIRNGVPAVYVSDVPDDCSLAGFLRNQVFRTE